MENRDRPRLQSVVWRRKRTTGEPPVSGEFGSHVCTPASQSAATGLRRRGV